MSLDTIHQKFRNVEKSVSTKKLLLFGFLVAVLSVEIVSLVNPTYLYHYPTLLLRVIMLSMLTMAFMTMYLTFVAGGLATGIMLTWILIKSRDKFYEKNGILAGNSIATNHEFLRTLAKGLHPKLIGFIRGYNDPRFEEQEVRHKREIQELREKSESDKSELKAEIKRIFDKSEHDKEEILRELRIKNLVIPKITNLKNTAERALEEYKKKDAEKEQEIGEKAHAHNNTENTNSLDTDEKFE